MKPLFITVLLALATYLMGQTSYENAMNASMLKWENPETTSDYNSLANEFNKIARENPNEWEPRYYSILVKVVASFGLPKEDAIKEIEATEKEFQTLKTIDYNDEVKVLEALMHTVKVAKEPMQYGPTLSLEIISIYNKALQDNPKNPRALFHLAEYQINSAPYFGHNPKDFCPQIQESLVLFAQEKQDAYAPKWGEERAQKAWDRNCK